LLLRFSRVALPPAFSKRKVDVTFIQLNLQCVQLLVQFCLAYRCRQNLNRNKIIAGLTPTR